MAKVIAATVLTLDDDVASLISRVGALNNPKDYISKYTVERSTGAPTFVTVTFIADGEFLKDESISEPIDFAEERS